MANREEGVATPNQRQGQEQPQQQDVAGQRHLHINWSNFSFRDARGRCRSTFTTLK